MRDVRFRAWNGVSMDFDPVVWGSHEDGECWINGAIQWQQEQGLVFMQFTGLLDKNGKEIYFSDIVKAPVDYGPAGERDAIYKVADDEYGHNLSKYQFEPYNRVEIIGNIYENPELLKENK